MAHEGTVNEDNGTTWHYYAESPYGPHCCPVCNGRGTVPSDFYGGAEATGTTAPEHVPCRACGGTGIVWPPREERWPTLPPQPAPQWPPYPTPAPQWPFWYAPPWPQITWDSTSNLPPGCGGSQSHG